MGNSECLSRNKQPQQQLIPELRYSMRPSQIKLKKQLHQNALAKNQFLYNIDLEFLCLVAKILNMASIKNNPDPYSHYLAKKIIQLSTIVQSLPELQNYNYMKELYSDYTYCRGLLMLNSYNIQKSIKRIQEDITFKSTIRMELNEDEQNLIKEMIFFAGEDFKNNMCLLIKINRNRGKLKISQLQSYINYFIDQLYFEISKKNNFNNSLNFLIDCEQSDLNIKFIQYLIELSLKHFLLIIKKIYVVNMNIELISSEQSTILSQPIVKHFALCFSAQFKQFLPKYLKKSKLIEDYGGTYPNLFRPSIPFTLEQAAQINF